MGRPAFRHKGADATGHQASPRRRQGTDPVRPVLCAAAVLTVGLIVVWAAAAPCAAEDATIIEVFSDNAIHFAPDDPGAFETDLVRSEENGRVIVRTVGLPKLEGPRSITARVTVRPVPKDETSVHDPWDRAGNVRLSREGEADIELVKFVTAYGGITEYEVDVSHLAPLLAGPCTFRGFIDTWSSPGWRIDFTLAVDADVSDHHGSPSENPDWAIGLLYEESLTEELMRDGPIEVRVEIPEGIGRVVMCYLVSGHCTDGRDADEFVSKDNVISVDGTVVHRFRPWRDDCRQFRGINPYTRRWSDGWWSSDYSRSGWCPGDRVAPLELDLSDHLGPGSHVVRFAVEDVRPKDDDGHFGYWRISSHLFGWTE
jgi:hypothetical protein